MKVIEEGHEYMLENFHRCPSYELGLCWNLKFVKMDENGNYYDGTTNEEVLAMMIHRMKFLNAKLPCREASLAITKLEEALMWLNYRTANREKQGVEGKHILHDDN